MRLANRLLRIHHQIQENLHQLMRVTLNLRQPGLANEVHRYVIFPQRVSVQIERPFHHISKIDPRLACCCSMAICFRAESVVWLSCKSSLTPRMLVRGLFSSWATPPIIAPMAASRSLCTTWCSNFFSVVMSRTQMITPPSLESASKNWLAEARIVRPLPSWRRAPYSADPKIRLPEATSV